MKKKYIILIVTIVAIFLILYLSLTQIVPARIKPLLIEVIHNYTGKPVEIENIAFSLFRGLIVRNLTVQNLFANLPLKFSRINLSLKYPPLILQRKVVYRLSSTPAEIFNFQITSSGTFKLADKSLTSQINIGLPLGLLKFILRDTPWEIKGEKLNLSINLQIDAQRNILADIEVPLRNISLLISQYTFSGAGEINLNISKPAKSGKTNYKGKVKIEELSTTIPKEGEKFTLRDGDIDFDLRNIQINKLECKYLERTYLLKGTIKNLNRPEISLDITSEMLESKINFSYLQNSLDIKSVILKLPQSKLELQGLINDLKNLRGDIYLSGSIHTEDLKYLPFKLLSRSKGVSSLL
ncbi:MAG: AsmA family protein, partial [Candidatus Omnitrophica bacterium]|nr:AsmA family protein [Candidatus Omnitrophota bacterium]